MPKFRIPLRAVFYQEDGLWFGHCLEMDVIGHGQTRADAMQMLSQAIVAQIEGSIDRGDPSNIFFPADKRFFEMYSAGTETLDGSCIIYLSPLSRGDVEIEGVQTREYEGHLALA